MHQNPAGYAAPEAARDHGGGLDHAVATWGGTRAGWLDLSTGINPCPYPLPAWPQDARSEDARSGDDGSGDAWPGDAWPGDAWPGDAWTALPDRAAFSRLEAAARLFWNIPERAAVLACHGASAAISRLPGLWPAARVSIAEPTYNEHAAAFCAARWSVDREARPGADCQVVVHPNNPDGRLWQASELGNRRPGGPLIIDESFCDVCPEQSHIARAADPGTLVLKSFGKFWGLAGLRLGFVIGDPDLISRLAVALGPWAVSGPALHCGTVALADKEWAATTRARLARDAERMDRILTDAGAKNPRGTALFRLYDTGNAKAWQEAFARHHILIRVFPWSDTAIRLGLCAPRDFGRLEAAIAHVHDLKTT